MSDQPLGQHFFAVVKEKIIGYRVQVKAKVDGKQKVLFSSNAGNLKTVRLLLDRTGYSELDYIVQKRLL